ncbi:MAG: phosphohydrolase, partial [Bacteroidales bacterium]
DRLDYLRRDSFYTGVTEGTIGSERIIKMLNVANDQLVVDAKGIYSIEKFLIARRLMYWQVYLHKTVLAAEQLLVKILKRAKMLAGSKEKLFATPALEFFLYHDVNRDSLFSEAGSFDRKKVLEQFSDLDDNDIISAAKVWAYHPDFILSYLCKAMINRELFRIEIRNNPFDEDYVNSIKRAVKSKCRVDEPHIDYFVFTDSVSNSAYVPGDSKIKILSGDNTLTDITDASDMLNTSVLSKTIRKYFLCYPKNIQP